MNKLLLAGFAAFLATVGATSAMAYSTEYGNPALFGQVAAAGAPTGTDDAYPPRPHTKFGDLSLYGHVEASSPAQGQDVLVPVAGATGFTREFGNQPRGMTPRDPAGTSGYPLR